MVTIKDVAKKAGVSISTVSNVLNKNKFVSDDLTRRVTQAVSELDYTANPIAQKMKFKNTKTIGVISADLCGLFYPYILKGIYNILNPTGYRIIVQDTEGVHDNIGSINKLKQSMAGLINERVDGIIFASTIPEELEAGIISDIMKLSTSKKNTAFVCMEKDLSKFGIDSVFANSEKGAEMATNHLIDQGCSHICHISGPTHFTVAQDRIAGFKNTLAKRGLAFDEAKMLAHGDYSHKSGYLAMKELLYKMPEIDGVFPANDQMCVGVYKALSEVGRRIPEDVKVIGYDDVFISSVMEPPLSTIRVPKFKMGQKSAEMLLNQMNADAEYGRRQAVDTIEIESRLVIRRSTVPNAADDWIFMDW
jgi:DNA-binding LacI/PurR family transcriptional regulator